MLAARNRSAATAHLALLLLLGCGEATPAAAPATLLAKGSFATTFAGSPVSIDYTGLTTAATVTHRINKDAKGLACITQLDLSVARPDGSCRLDLQWQPGADGLRLAKVRFFAVVTKTQDGVVLQKDLCPGWPAETAPGEVVYEGESDGARISQGPLVAPLAAQAEAKLSGVKLTMTGSVDLKRGGKKFTVDLGLLSFHGALTSKGRTDVSCGQAGPAFGPAFCAKGAAYGNTPGSYLRRNVILTRCDDEEPYDLGELCGGTAIWITDYRDWTGVNTIVEGHRAVYDKFAPQGIAAAFVVVEGKEKVVVENPPGSKKFEASGPAPTAEGCLAIGKKFNLHPDVVLLYDKNKALLSNETKLAGVNFVPAMVFARGDGKIVSALPKSEAAPGPADVEAELTAAIEAE